MIKTGCCGFPVKRDLYFRELELVEIQQTFYQPPSPKTLERWREEAPKGFEFTLKAWQIITHPSSSPTYRRLKERLGKEENYGFFQPTSEVWKAWERVKEAGKILGSKFIVFQCPKSFAPSKENVENLKKFFSQVERENFIFVLELRGEWEDNLIKDLCRELNLIDGVDPFKRESVFGQFQYFRLHGKRGYSYRYSDEELKELKEWCKRKPTYCLFNNVYMWEDSLRFKNMI